MPRISSLVVAKQLVCHLCSCCSSCSANKLPDQGQLLSLKVLIGPMWVLPTAAGCEFIVQHPVLSKLLPLVLRVKGSLWYMCVCDSHNYEGEIS